VAIGAPLVNVPKDVTVSATFRKLAGPPGGGYGIIGDIVVGVIGALIGGFVFGLITGRSDGVNNLDIGSIVVAIIGDDKEGKKGEKIRK